MFMKNIITQVLHLELNDFTAEIIQPVIINLSMQTNYNISPEPEKIKEKLFSTALAEKPNYELHWLLF